MDYMITAFVMIWFVVGHVESKATIKVKVIYFYVNGRDWNGNGCDYIFSTACDPRFKFCIDHYNGNNDMNGCTIRSYPQTGHYQGGNHVIFSGTFHGGEKNPLVNTINYAYAGFKFKVEIHDDDHDNDDLIDRIFFTYNNAPWRSESEASWGNTLTKSGTRTNTEKTRIEVQVMVFCNPEYYGTACEVHCIPKDSAGEGHYTCDPNTGSKVCRAGWETVSEDCKVKKDDCEGHQCQNEATCVDHYKHYTCTCAPGYIGQRCENNVNECASQPCQNTGNCTDGINHYTCTCRQHYSGDMCEHHVCNTNPSYCMNGGTCINDNHIPQCLCHQQYTGSKCDVNTCDVIQCQNGGTCDLGTCTCPPAWTGALCDVDLCDHVTCLNGGTCMAGQCICAPGYTGRYCHINIDDCASSPCLNNGVCDEGLLQYTCRCQPDYYGNNCQHKLTTTTSTTTTPAPTTTTPAPTTTTPAPTTTTPAPTTTTPTPTTTTLAPTTHVLPATTTFATTTTTPAPTTTTLTPATKEPTTTTLMPTTKMTTLGTSTTLDNQSGMNQGQGSNSEALTASNGTPWWIILLITAILLLCTVIVMVAALYFRQKRRKATQSRPIVIDDGPGLANFENPLYSDENEVGAMAAENKHNIFINASKQIEEEEAPGYYDNMPDPPPYSPRTASDDISQFGYTSKTVIPSVSDGNINPVLNPDTGSEGAINLALNPDTGSEGAINSALKPDTGNGQYILDTVNDDECSKLPVGGSHACTTENVVANQRPDVVPSNESLPGNNNRSFLFSDLNTAFHRIRGQTSEIGNVNPASSD